MKKIDIIKLKQENKAIKIGKLTKNIINILEIEEKPRSIKMWSDRIEHCEKHIKDFKDIQSYNKSMKSIPTILNNPDYVGMRPNDNSIQYIKKLDDITLVAIRIKTKGDLFLRSVYPISEDKLNYYIKTNKIRKV